MQGDRPQGDSRLSLPASWPYAAQCQGMGRVVGESLMKRCWVVAFAVLVVSAALAALAAPAFALVPDGAQGWFWQMPQPAGDLSDVAFAGATQVFAVGDDGLILHSSDAGATWAAEQSGTDADLRSVSFPDDQHGWVCGGKSAVAGDSGVVLASTDGGATWLDKTPNGLSASLTRESFVSATQGWIGTGDGRVLRTTDGGDTWQTARVGAYMGPVAVDFADSSHGWAGGTKGRIWKTVNGGTTWTSLTSGLGTDTQVLQLDCVDRSHCWGLAQSQNTGVSTVIVTSNGGARWNRLANTDWAASELDVTSASSVWLLAGDYGSYGGELDPDAFAGWGVIPIDLQHTTDGGAHWQTSSLGAPANEYAIASAGDAVCAVGDGILVSADGGGDWRSAGSGQQYLFAGADALSDTDIWAVEGYGALLHSTDGARWTEQPSPERWTDVVLSGVSFADPNDGWVVGYDKGQGAGVILHTSDGGGSWAPEASKLGSVLGAVQFVGDQNGWVLADDPTIGDAPTGDALERTTDGGKKWIPEWVDDGATLAAVDFLADGTTGWVAGDSLSAEDEPSPAIYGSTDGGQTWQKETLPALSGSEGQITGLQFTDASTGWAVGTGDSFAAGGFKEYNYLLHTTDGGQTWTQAPAAGHIGATTVCFSDPLHGWLGATDGVYATTDGGTTWQHVAGGDAVTAIAAGDAQHVWAFGWGFLVSTVDSADDTAAPATLDEHFDWDAWHRKSAAIVLSANDIGGSSVASTDCRVDGGPWQPASTIVVDAPADHGNDGVHTVFYRSTDTVGNREQTESVQVGIDTFGPACSAPRKSVVNTGKSGILFFRARDAASGVARATVSVVNAEGHQVRTFVERAGSWYGSLPYYWLRFKCTLKPGTYRIEVRATDGAGNPQVTIGRNTLRVVRSGAPAPRRPAWPAGLPGHAFASRLGYVPGRHLQSWSVTSSTRPASDLR